MKIIEANLEVVDLTETKIQVDSSEVKIHMAEVNKIRIHTKANIKTMAIKVTITKAIEVYIITHAEIFQQGNNYGQFRGRSHGRGRGNYHGRGHGRSNY